MSNLPPLKSLQYFLVAAQSKNFKQAAERLYVSQAAVSLQIRLLEAHLDARLFERTNRQTSLTTSGRQLLPFIERAFNEFNSGIQLISKDTNPNVLRLSAAHSFSSLWLIPKLQNFQHLRPELMVQVAPSASFVDFDSSGVDLAIRLGRGGYQNVDEIKILEDHLIMVASPALIADIDINNVEQVFSLPWLQDTSEGIQTCFENYCQQQGVAHNLLVPAIQTNDSLPLVESAIQGRGFMMVNSCLVSEYLNNGMLVKLLNYGQVSPYSLYLVAPKQHFTWPKVQRFVDWFLPQFSC